MILFFSLLLLPMSFVGAFVVPGGPSQHAPSHPHRGWGFPISQQTRTTTTTTTTTTLYLLDSLFGSSSDTTPNDDGDKLACFSNLPVDQYDGLTEYIRQWALLLEKQGLTTPVKVVTIEQGAQILFKPKVTSYKSKSEERASEQGTAEKEKKPKKDGGVEVLVQQTSSGQVQVLARRCEMDEDTMIREMSEVAIIDGLKKAINVWKKDHLK